VTARVVLVGKPGCHLCDVAREVVELVCAEADLDFTEINIWDDPGSADRYADRIPVVLVNDVEIAWFRVDSQQLRTAIADG
jgi:glutaredoxin